MAFKQFALDEQTTVTIYKRRASRSLKLTIAHDGAVRVSMPVWAPYRMGLEFARSRRNWIAQQAKVSQPLIDGQAIGKAHHLQFVPDPMAEVPTSRVSGTTILVRYPSDLVPEDKAVQKVAHDAGVRALRSQAAQLLPGRVQELASRHNFSYNSVSIKQLKSRWGSCDQNADLVFNLYLMQLPWECIDYVLLHELTHTRVLQHGPVFWQALTSVMPAALQIQKRMKDYQPFLHSPAQQTVQ